MLRTLDMKKIKWKYYEDLFQGGGPNEFLLSVHCTQTNTCCTPYKQTHIHTQTIKYTHTHKQTDSHTDMVFILL